MTRLLLGVTGLVGIGAALIVVPNLQSQTPEGPPAEIAPSEDPPNLRKWAFPGGTKIGAGGRLVVWADEDGKATGGLHASFKLSQKGETVYLVDSDANRNVVLDSLIFPAQRTDVAFGKSTDGKLQPVVPSPGK